MACCSRGVRGMLMAGKCNRFLRVSELSVSTWIRRFLGKIEIVTEQDSFTNK